MAPRHGAEQDHLEELVDWKCIGAGLAEASPQSLAMAEIMVLASWSQVLEYCPASMGFEAKEQFRILFLDKRNQIIADECSRRAPSTTPRSMSARW